VPFIESISYTDPIVELSGKADGVIKNQISNTPWAKYTYRPYVSFAIAHAKNCILLKYYVTEKNSRAVYCNSNDPVFKDSCVEFFISFGDDKRYYNFEFNCFGTCLLGFGANRVERRLLPAEIIKKIHSQTVISPDNGSSEQKIHWQLTLAIPFEVFSFHSIISLKEQDCKVNFYKCGDDLPEPHFLVWNNIIAPYPDFHLSQYFGGMKFL
jgi:Carbohydrate-binding family 9